MTTEYITVNECCVYHHIETSFLYSLQHAGLIQITEVETVQVIALEQLPELEQYIRWHYELDINTEGMETIRHLLKKMGTLQDEVRLLKDKLKFYE